jgi:hypothetical protein
VHDKARCLDPLLVHDTIISPLPEESVGDQTIRRRLAARYAHPVPKATPAAGLGCATAAGLILQAHPGTEDSAIRILLI